MGKLIKRHSPREEADDPSYSDQISGTIDKDVEDDSEIIYSNKTEDLLPTGSTLLNCACSDNPEGGYALGTVVIGIGDSSSGKSFLMLTALAEACSLLRFDDYDLYYDDAEAAFAYDAKKLFGKNFIYDEKTDTGRVFMCSSDTVQEFYGRMVQALNNKRPFIYVLDSYDFLSEEEERARAEVTRKKTYGEKLTKKEQKSKGGYKTEKVRVFAEVFRRCRRELADTNSLFIVIFQTIDAINAQFVSKTRRGGNAPKFAASHELWMRVIDSYENKGLEIGVDSGVRVKKNKITGKVRDVSFPIYNDYGIDDIRSCVEFLVEQGYWGLEKRTIEAHHFNFKGTLDKVISHIEQNSLEGELRRHTGECWRQREESVKINRKRRF
jgi:RecA/RadA recombinase